MVGLQILVNNFAFGAQKGAEKDSSRKTWQPSQAFYFHTRSLSAKPFFPIVSIKPSEN